MDLRATIPRADPATVTSYWDFSSLPAGNRRARVPPYSCSRRIMPFRN